MDESFIDECWTLLLNSDGEEEGLEELLVFKVMLLVKEVSSVDMDSVDTVSPPPPRIIDLLTKLLNPSTCLSLSEIFHNLIVLSLVESKK